MQNKMQPTQSHGNLTELHRNLGDLNLSDKPSRTATSTPSSRHKTSIFYIADSSPPELTGQGFVPQKSLLTPPADSNPSDPFQSHMTSRVTSRAPSNASFPASPQAGDDVFRGGAKLPSDNVKNLEENQATATAPSDAKIAPRADRLAAPITSENAQGVLPPEALVFVAKYAVNLALSPDVPS